MNRTPLETARLILRPPVEADAELIYRGWGTDTEVTRYVMWRPHRTIEDTHRYLRFIAGCWADGVECTWLICLKPATPDEEAAPIGAISLRLDGFKGNMGYVLARPHWGRGYMTEAGR